MIEVTVLVDSVACDVVVCVNCLCPKFLRHYYVYIRRKAHTLFCSMREAKKWREPANADD